MTSCEHENRSMGEVAQSVHCGGGGVCATHRNAKARKAKEWDFIMSARFDVVHW